jgi:phenylacetic acid degradation operon negative regulatory protein
MPPTPRSLIVDLLSSMRGHPMPVRALVAAGEVFGIRPESVRVALVRLQEQGTMTRNERGFYSLSAAAQAVQQRVVAWTHLEDRIVAWRGGWLGVLTAGLPRADRTRLRHRQRALEFLGLRALEGDLWVRPDNLRGGAEAVHAELVRLGLESEAPFLSIAQLDERSETQARSLWDIETLNRGYRNTRIGLERSAARLPKLSQRQAMVESFHLGGDAIRQVVLDPLLPEALVAGDERRRLTEMLRRYDRLGRDCWRPFLREHGASELRAPRSSPHLHRPQTAAVGA